MSGLASLFVAVAREHGEPREWEYVLWTGEGRL